MSYPNWSEPICHHYVAGGASHCAAWIAYESVVWPLLGYLDNLPCFDEELPCPKRLLETREERAIRTRQGEAMQVQYVYLIRTEPGKESALQVPSARKETIETMKICGFVEVPAADYARFLHELEAIEAGGAK